MSNKQIILNTLSKDAHWQVNKKITAYFKSTDVAIYLANLISWYQYFENQGKLQADESFYTTITKIQEETYLSKRIQFKIIKILRADGIVTTKLKGLPAKQFKILNFDKIADILSSPSRYETVPTRKYETVPTNNKNKYNKVSKDTKGESKKQDSLLKRSFGNRCVKVWNEFPFTVTHKSPTIIKTIDLFMKELIQGTFLENKSISKEYFKRHKISLNGKQYTKTRLLQGIRNVALYSKQGYPDLRTKDLSSLIYNDRTGTSVFLSVLASPPKPLSEERPINDSNQRITDLFIDLFEIHNDTDKVRLVDGIKSLVKYQEKIKLRIPKMHRLYGTPYKLCKTYCEWIGMQEWVDTIHIGMIRADGKMFKKFIEDQEEDCWGYSLVPERRVK